MMSPGRVAVPLGMFSVAGMQATTLPGSSSSAIAAIVSSTAAPPDMSIFISSILAEGLMEIPPVSKVTALPTSPIVSPPAPPPEYRRLISCGSCALPCETAIRPPMPRSAIWSRPSTSTSTESWAPAISRARSARYVGVTTFAGSAWSSRARFAASAATRARVTAPSRSPAEPGAEMTRRSRAGGGGSSGSRDLKRSNLKEERIVPSTSPAARVAGVTPAPPDSGSDQAIVVAS